MRAARLHRTECEINGFGRVMLEVNQNGVRVVSRERAGEVHSWTWDYLKSVCRCPVCRPEGGQSIEASIV